MLSISLEFSPDWCKWQQHSGIYPLFTASSEAASGWPWQVYICGICRYRHIMPFLCKRGTRNSTQILLPIPSEMPLSDPSRSANEEQDLCLQGDGVGRAYWRLPRWVWGVVVPGRHASWLFWALCSSDTFVLWYRALLPQKGNFQKQQRRWESIIWRLSPLWPPCTYWPVACLGTEHLTESCYGMRRLLRSTLTPSGEPTDLFRLAERAISGILQYSSIHLSGILSPHLLAGMGLWRRLEQARRWPDGSLGSGVLPAQLPNLYLRKNPVPCLCSHGRESHSGMDYCPCLLCMHIVACDRPSSYSKTSYCCAGMTWQSQTRCMELPRGEPLRAACM